MVDVEINYAEQFAVLKTDKREAVFTLFKDPYRFGFIFKVNKASVPEELSGRFSSLTKGIEFFKSYERTIKESQAAKSERLAKHREERRAKSNATDS